MRDREGSGWNSATACGCLRQALPVLLLLSVVSVGGCGSSYGASVAAERLRNATRLELLPRADLFNSLTTDAGVVLSSEQVDSMGFPDNAAVTDPNTISQLARLLKEAGFRRTLSRYPATVFSLCVAAYRGDESLGSFEINADALYVPGFGTFRTRRGEEYVQRELRRILPYGRSIENVIRRAGDLEFIALTLMVHVLDPNSSFSSVRDRWCDAMLDFASTHVERLAADLRKPPYIDGHNVDIEGTLQAAREWVAAVEQILSSDGPDIRWCSFALNSQYGDDPQEDTILLFEAESGWNRVGGPELLPDQFTDPDGCFVYVNELGVRFIPNEQVKRIKAAAAEATRQNHPFEFRYSTLLQSIED